MKTFILMLIGAVTFGQAKWEDVEFTGTVLSIRPGYGFALEIIELETEQETRYFKLDPPYGQSILSKIKEGQSLTLKARVNQVSWENYKKNKKLSTAWGFRLAHQITDVKLGDTWVTIPWQGKPYNIISNFDMKVFVEKKVVDVYRLDGIKKGLILENGIISFAVYATPKHQNMEKIEPGSFVSFIGYRCHVKDEYLYPIDGVKEVYSYTSLEKTEGVISAFVYKQNFARIGLVINNKRLSFITEYGKQMENFANDDKVTVYYSGIENEKNNLLPTIHAVIQGGDTLIIPRQYYGAPDGKHEYKPAELDGKISKINRSDNGKIISLIMGNDCYVEVDQKMIEQLGSYLSKGKQIKIMGEERIKKEGEIYEKDYRIITPRKVVADGKEFILKK